MADGYCDFSNAPPSGNFESDRVAVDPVFGSGEFAYRINADTQTISVAWSHTLGRRTALNVIYTYRRSQAASDLGIYSANVVGVNFTYSY